MEAKLQADGRLVENKGLWRKFFHLVRLARIPWIGIILYFCCNLFTVYVAVNLPQVEADIYTGNASIANIAWVIIVELISGLLVCVMLAAYGVIGGLIDRNFRNAIWQKILRMEPKYFDKVSANTLLSRMTDDAESMKDFILLIISEVTSAATTVATIAAMSTMNRGLAVIMIVFIPVITVFSFLLGRLKMIFGNTVKYKMASLTDYLSGHLARIAVIKAYNREAYETARGERQIRDYYIAQKKTLLADFFHGTLASILSLAPTITLLLVGIYLLEKKSLTPAGWIVFYAYANNLLYFFTSKADTWIYIKEYQGHMNRLTELFEEPDESSQKYLEDVIEPGEIIFEHVSFAYDSRKILDDVSFTVPENKFTVIAGPSGAGKTTILKLIERFYEPDEGRILLHEHVLSDYNRGNLRQLMAYVKQDTPLISGSIRENILYGITEDISDAEILAGAREVDAETFITDCPGGLDFEVGQFGSKLSGGQRQKLSLIRAFLQKRPYILLDEPTASLDVISASDVADSISRMIGKRTIILVAHDNRLIKRADHIIAVDEKGNVHQGTLEEVSAQSAFVGKMLKSGEGEQA